MNAYPDTGFSSLTAKRGPFAASPRTSACAETRVTQKRDDETKQKFWFRDIAPGLESRAPG